MDKRCQGVIDGLLQTGLKHKLLIEKYMNMDVLKADTISVLCKTPTPCSWDKHQRYIRKLIKMWFPAIASITDEGSVSWSGIFDLDLEVQELLNKNGFKEEDEF